MKQILSILIILLINGFAFSQKTKSRPVLTEKQNAEWFMKFKQLTNKSEKITRIKQKIFSDSIYIRKNTFNIIGCRVDIEKTKSLMRAMKKGCCECKIVFALKFKKQSYQLDPTEYTKVNEILELVEPQNIEEIKVLNGNSATELYGVNGKCGAVIMYSNNRKVKRTIENML
ncbi:hypothetical protein [Aquimarina sp. AU119]|uniref:hypothetical protein n=2 Tax=Aquimarina TaxID=290174 RepID=UPI000D6910B7|nr:hypothetical protein [Aquimarina sp. AU119]